MFDNYRSVLDSYRPAVTAGVVPRMNLATLEAQSAILKKYSADVKVAAGNKQQTGACGAGGGFRASGGVGCRQY